MELGEENGRSVGEAQDSHKSEAGKCYYYVLSVSRSEKIRAMLSWNSDRKVPVGRSAKGQPGSLLLTFQLLKWGGARLLPRPVLATTCIKRISVSSRKAILSTRRQNLSSCYEINV